MTDKKANDGLVKQIRYIFTNVSFLSEVKIEKFAKVDKGTNFFLLDKWVISEATKR